MIENHTYVNTKHINAGIGYLDEEYFAEQLENVLKDVELPYENIKFYLANHACSSYVTQPMLQQFGQETDTLTVYVDSYVYGFKNIAQLKSNIYGIDHARKLVDEYLDPGMFKSSIGEPIYSPEGVDIAEYIKEYNTLIIHYNIFLHRSILNLTHVLGNILKEVGYIHSLTDEEIEENRRKRQIELISQVLIDSYDTQLTSDLDTLKDTENEIRVYKQGLVHTYKKQESILRSIDSLKKVIDGDKTRIYDEISIILSLDKVEDMTVRDGDIIIKTKLLYGHTESGEVYKLAPYEIGIDFKTGKVYMDCEDEYKRQSCWGSKCPHPHVSNLGEPCLGNVAATVAELISASELLALTTILINYLESINTQDVAGKNCVYWDRVDPETLEVISDGTMSGNQIECEVCGSIIHEDDAYYCEDCDRHMCNDCTIYITDIDEYRCVECEGYTQCDSCYEYYGDENMYVCDNCGNNICTNCAIEFTTTRGDTLYFCCEDCRDDYVRSYIVSCDICGEDVFEHQLYTCEVCAKQGDLHCIQQSDDGAYRCTECYKEYRESGE